MSDAKVDAQPQLLCVCGKPAEAGGQYGPFCAGNWCRKSEDHLHALRSQCDRRIVFPSESAKLAVEEIERLRRLEAAVKKALAQDYDDICWLDLYKEMAHQVGVKWSPKLLPRSIHMRNCGKFIDSMIVGCQYETPKELPVVEEALRVLSDWATSRWVPVTRMDAARELAVNAKAELDTYLHGPPSTPQPAPGGE